MVTLGVMSIGSFLCIGCSLDLGRFQDSHFDLKPTSRVIRDMLMHLIELYKSLTRPPCFLTGCGW
jgi:hypothetical protein